MKRQLFIIFLCGLFAGCVNEKTDPSGKYVHRSYSAHEAHCYGIYESGTIREAENALIELLKTHDKYQEKDPHVYAYEWPRGLTQARLSAIYRQLGGNEKSNHFMKMAIESIKRYCVGESKSAEVVDEINEAWMLSAINELDKNLKPKWKNTQPGNREVRETPAEKLTE